MCPQTSQGQRVSDTRRKHISQKAPIVGSQFQVYDLTRLISGAIPFKSMMINFCQPEISSTHMCSVSSHKKGPVLYLDLAEPV